MAIVTLDVADTWQPTQFVSAWLARNLPAGAVPAGGSAASAVVEDDGSLTFDGLSEGESYVAYAVGKFRHFSVGEGAGLSTVALELPVGTTVVAAAAHGRRIRVRNYTAVADGAATLQWMSGATELSGPMSFGQNGGAAPEDYDGVIETPLGGALSAVVTGAAINGHAVIAYIGRG